jgi:hypothetical protein
MLRNMLQWIADSIDLPSGFCGHRAKARIGNYVIAPSGPFGPFRFVHYRVSYLPTGTVIESRTIGHYRTLPAAKAAAQRDHDEGRDQG